MSRDFDRERLDAVAKRDLEFKAGGETFRVIEFVSPETLDTFKPMDRAGEKTVVEIYDEWIVSMVVEEDRPKWAKVRKESDPPLELHTIENIVFWLVEVATGRPTVRPSSSRSGPQTQAAGSPVTSPSQGVQVV